MYATHKCKFRELNTRKEGREMSRKKIGYLISSANRLLYGVRECYTRNREKEIRIPTLYARIQS